MVNYFLIQYINQLHLLINTLYILLTGKVLFTPKKDEPVKKEYRKLEVDELPLFDIPKKLDFNQLLKEYEIAKGKVLKPVRLRKNKQPLPSNIKCPCCNAPHTYIYDNNGGRGALKCKVCNATFSSNPKQLKEVILRCPHCGKTLEKIKQRDDFDIFKCRNNKCTYYLNKLKSMTSEEKAKFKSDPQSFKVRYIFREFNIDFKPLSKDNPITPKVFLPKIMSSSHTFGLILTYYVNYGISSRKTAALMKDVHGIKLSHQTVLNYVDAASYSLEYFVNNYEYDLSDSFCGDETYIRVNGKWHYIFFFFDAVKKIILSHRVSPHRDTETAIKAINDVLIKFKKIPETLNLITDGNPIYLLARQFFACHDIHFDVTQVIGLTNEDEVSREYRPLKQIIERLNRSFKGNYRSTGGFKSDSGSVSYVSVFTAYFNFLKTHQSLNNKVPVQLPELEKLPTMPARWCKLIQIAEDFCISQATA